MLKSQYKRGDTSAQIPNEMRKERHKKKKTKTSRKFNGKMPLGVGRKTSTTFRNIFVCSNIEEARVACLRLKTQLKIKEMHERGGVGKGLGKTLGKSVSWG